MYINRLILIYFVNYLTSPAETQNIDLLSNVLDSGKSLIKVIEADLYLINDKLKKLRTETVRIDLYYECLCPDCRQFDTKQLIPVVQKLSQYLDIHTYPYGNAKTIKHNDHYEFKCQHGPMECYGNMLHACAIHILRNITESVFYNACMMENTQQNRGSDDLAADVCGKSMNIDPDPIKACAKSEKGTELLKYYGDLSEKINFSYVPYILINGILSDGTNFMRDVCSAFINPPIPCV